ncbi:MAG: hypothetical protein ACXVHL_27505 [Solirubrobacteraceae bacterium]
MSATRARAVQIAVLSVRESVLDDLDITEAGCGGARAGATALGYLMPRVA